jgi:hypothetical protein
MLENHSVATKLITPRAVFSSVQLVSRLLRLEGSFSGYWNSLNKVSSLQMTGVPSRHDFVALFRLWPHQPVPSALYNIIHVYAIIEIISTIWPSPTPLHITGATRVSSLMLQVWRSTFSVLFLYTYRLPPSTIWPSPIPLHITGATRVSSLMLQVWRSKFSVLFLYTYRHPPTHNLFASWRGLRKCFADWCVQ